MYPYEAKYQLLISKKESESLKYLNDSKAFMEYSNVADDIYKNIEKCNPNKERKILIEFDDMIADILSNGKPNPTIAELIIRTKRISLVFIIQPYFAAPKTLY